MFLRILQHLLPRSRAWAIVVDKLLRQFFAALAEVFEDAKEHVEYLWTDWPSATTTRLAEWVSQWGIGAGSSANQRAMLLAARQATGGQGPEYLQGLLQTAGFNVYVHGPWEPGSPRTARDPTNLAANALVGLTQCGDPDAQCGDPDTVCDSTTIQRPGYIVNLDLTSRAQPPIPSDPSTWGNWIYVGGETFGEVATIEADRRDEFERMLMTYFPAECWIGLYIQFGANLIGEDGSNLIGEDGSNLVGNS